MSLEKMRIDENKRNAFLSNCFKFVWLGKYKIDIHFSKNRVSVFITNFDFVFDDDNLPFVISSIGKVSCKHFYDVKIALDYFNLVSYTLISDFSIKSQEDFEEFFDFNRMQGFHEWLPDLHNFFK